MDIAEDITLKERYLLIQKVKETMPKRLQELFQIKLDEANLIYDIYLKNKERINNPRPTLSDSIWEILNRNPNFIFKNRLIKLLDHLIELKIDQWTSHEVDYPYLEYKCLQCKNIGLKTLSLFYESLVLNGFSEEELFKRYLKKLRR